MSRLTRDGTAEPASRDQTLRRERGQGNVHFPCSADHEQHWQVFQVDTYSDIYVMTIYTYVHAISSETRTYSGLHDINRHVINNEQS